MKAFSILLLTAIALWAGPQISVNQAAYDFGTLPEGDTVIAYPFVISNTGDAILHLQSVKPSCSCTIVEFPSELAPGESAEILVEFRTRGKHGRQNRPVTIISDSDENPIMRVAIQGFLLGAINMERQYGFYQLEEGQTEVRDSFALISMSPDLEITNAFYRANQADPADTTVKMYNIDAQLTVVNEGNDSDPTEYMMNITFPVEIEVDESGTLSFATNHPEKPLLEFRCIIRKEQ